MSELPSVRAWLLQKISALQIKLQIYEHHVCSDTCSYTKPISAKPEQGMHQIVAQAQPITVLENHDQTRFPIYHAGDEPTHVSCTALFGLQQCITSSLCLLTLKQILQGFSNCW